MRTPSGSFANSEVSFIPARWRPWSSQDEGWSKESQKNGVKAHGEGLVVIYFYTVDVAVRGKGEDINAGNAAPFFLGATK